MSSSRFRRRVFTGTALVLITAGVVSVGSAGAGGRATGDRFREQLTLTTVISGSSLTHPLTSGSSEPLSQPDDLTSLDGVLYVVFQNGVGADGSASPSGNLDSTVVGFTPGGSVVGQWDIVGHADGLAADPDQDRLIVTVNEDANSSLYTIEPSAPASGQVQHFTYAPSPLPHGGGTDAVSIFHGQILISASAPTVADGPALYRASLEGATATLQPVFSDQATATVANAGSDGQQTTLALTDPDSNEVVPHPSPRFGGDFVLDSQGDEQQIYVRDLDDGAASDLQVLNLSQSVNDTAWATDPHGTLYVSDHSAGDIVAVRGFFDPGTPYVAVTPCGANSAPGTCPAPGFAGNYLGTLDPFTGDVEPVNLPAGATLEPEGLLFVSGGASSGPPGHDD